MRVYKAISDGTDLISVESYDELNIEEIGFIKKDGFYCISITDHYRTFLMDLDYSGSESARLRMIDRIKQFNRDSKLNIILE